MFNGRHCLDYPLDLVRMIFKPKESIYHMVPYTLTPFPPPLLSITLTYESVPPGIIDFIGSYFLNTAWGLGTILKLQLLHKQST